MDQPTHWIDGRQIDGHAPLDGSLDGADDGSPWSRLLAVLVLLLILDLVLAALPAPAPIESPLADDSAQLRTTLARADLAAEAGRRTILMIGDSVLAGDVMAGKLEPGLDWRSQRVIDHMRAELSADAKAQVELHQVALDGLLPVDAVHLLAELDRIDPGGAVELVLELNLRAFSASYGAQSECTRPSLAALGASPLAGAAPEQPDAGTPWRALTGLYEGAGLLRDHIATRVPIHRHRDALGSTERGSLDHLAGLAVRRGAAPSDDPSGDPSGDPAGEDRQTEGLARVQEHYRSCAIIEDHAQVRALLALLDRLHAHGRRASLFLTPLEDAFASGALPGNQLGRRYEQLARLVDDHAAGRSGRVQLLNLDHPLFESHAFLDHVHLQPDGARLLALNLLHELGLPLATRPFEWMMVHDEDHDRTLVHRRGIGFAEGGAWQTLMRSPDGVAVSRDGGWVVIADSGNHMLRQLRGNMQTLERLAGRPNKAGGTDGPALGRARLEAPRSPEILGERVYFIDGPGSQRVRELSDGYVRTLAWTGPRCHRYVVLESGRHAGREWLYLLCHDDRILALDLARARTIVLVDPRAPLLADPTNGAPRGFTSIEPTGDGRLFFADGAARIWELPLRDDGHSRAPRRVFDNTAEEDLPNEFKRTYPFGFDEVRVQKIVGMEWVERYGALLIQDWHALGVPSKRLEREETERVHLRLLDFEDQIVLPWIKPTPHGDAHTMWNAISQNLVSYYHRGAMAIAADDASLFWVERTRSRVFRIADGLLGVQQTGNLHTTWSKVERLNVLGTQTSKWVGSQLRPDRYLDTRHEPIPHRGPYVALMFNSSFSAVSDRIGNYSLGRVLEEELQAELGYRDNIRLDLYQRTSGGVAFSYEVGMFEAWFGNGPPPDVVLFELADFRGRFLRKSKTRAARLAVLADIERLAKRYGTLVLFYDNSAMEADGVDGLRARTPALAELITEIEQLGFVVLEPADWLLDELLRESPWGSQPWGPGQHHGAPWAIDQTARALAAMAAPLIRTHLRDRVPARLSEQPLASFDDDGDSRKPLLAALGDVDALQPTSLPRLPNAFIERRYANHHVLIHLDLAGLPELGRDSTKLDEVALALLVSTLVDMPYGGLVRSAKVVLAEFQNYDEYGQGVLESAKPVWSREFEFDGLVRFVDAHRRRSAP